MYYRLLQNGVLIRWQKRGKRTFYYENRKFVIFFVFSTIIIWYATLLEGAAGSIWVVAVQTIQLVLFYWTINSAYNNLLSLSSSICKDADRCKEIIQGLLVLDEAFIAREMVEYYLHNLPIDFATLGRVPIHGGDVNKFHPKNRMDEPPTFYLKWLLPPDQREGKDCFQKPGMLKFKLLGDMYQVRTGAWAGNVDSFTNNYDVRMYVIVQKTLTALFAVVMVGIEFWGMWHVPKH